MHNNTITPPAGGQLHLAKTDKSDTLLHDETDKAATPARDDTDALLDVAREAAAAGLVPADLIDRMDGYSRLGMASKAQSDLADALANGPAAERALDSILAAFQPGDVLEICALDPAEKERGLSRNADPFTPEGRASLEAFIREHIGHRNLYFGANPRNADLDGTGRHATNADVAARRTAFVDMDLKDAPDTDPGWTRTRAELEALGPVLLVETGNGFHAHFRVEDLTGEALAASVPPLEQAMAAMGSDNMADPRRIARLPWTVNLPKDNKRARGAVPVLARSVGLKGRNLPPAPRPVEDLSAALVDVATRLALPGRKSGSGADGSASASTVRTGERTADPAPSLAILRMVMEELPNGPTGPFLDRAGKGQWISVRHALKNAAKLGGIDEAGALEIWLEWCAKHGGDPVEDARVFNGKDSPRNGFGTLMSLLEQHNPAGHSRVKLAMAQAAFPPLPASFGLQPVQPFKGAALPPRRWLYGRVYSAGYVSMLVAPGGTGKSALTMAEAVAMATGKTLLPGDTPHHAMRVLYHNAEDDLDEQRRRLEATLRHHGVTHADLGGRLFLTSGRDLPLTLARQGRDGIVVNRDAVERLVAEMTSAGIEVLILDPLGAMHELPENSNEAANVLMGVLREIAERTGAAIGLIHHTGKMAAKDMDAAGAGAARGASAFVDGARFVRQLQTAGKNDKGLGIPAPDRWKYVRVGNGKANLAPAGAARWLRLVSVSLNNGTADYPDGDHVQTVETWVPTGTTSFDTPANAWAAFQALAGADVSERRLDMKSPGWVGFIFADALGLDVGQPGVKRDDLAPHQSANREAVENLIAAGVRSGWIIRVEEYIPENKRKGPVFSAGEAPPEPNDAPDRDLAED